LIVADANACGYWHRGRCLSVAFDNALFERSKSVALEEREASTPTGEAAVAARVGEAVRIGAE
jgi:hypothetical protein